MIQSLRDQFRDFGADAITRKAKETLYIRGAIFEDEYAVSNTAVVVPLLERVWQQYGHLDAFQLSDMTHEPGSPWHQVAAHYRHQSREIPWGATIPNGLIKDYFEAKAAERPAQRKYPQPAS